MSAEASRSQPLGYVYVAPDVAPTVGELTQPPRLVVGPDGALLIETYNEAGESVSSGRVLHIDRFPPYALVQVLDSGPPDDPYDPPVMIGYLVRLEALP